MGIEENLPTANVFEEPDTIEAVPVVPPEARKLNFLDNVKIWFNNKYDWLSKNYEDLLIGLAIVFLIVGVYSINTAFYVLAVVDPSKWTFINTSVAEAFYIFWMVIWTTLGVFLFVQPLFGQFESGHKHRWIPFTVSFVIYAIFVSMPFWLSHHYLHVAYNNLCNEYIYELEIVGNKVMYEGNNIYNIKTSLSGSIFTVTTGPDPWSGDTLITTFDGIENIINYDQRLDLYNSSILSTNKYWYKSSARFESARSMNHPSDKIRSKVCTNKFGEFVLQITTIVPVMQQRMATCVSCMTNCLNECKRWETYYVPYSYQTCDKNNRCTTHSGIRQETSCVQYYSYSECNYRCAAPACIAINL